MKLLVVAGFLGSGKTTLLLGLARALVQQRGQTVAIIENEVGKVGVDDQYLVGQGLQVRNIFGGCVCCSLGANLLVTLQQLQQRLSPDVVIVEPSGIAGPGSLRQLMDGYEGALEGLNILVLFDAHRFKAFSHVAGPFVETSIEAADVVIITKIDLVPEEQVRALRSHVLGIKPEARVLAMSATTQGDMQPLLSALQWGSKQPTSGTRGVAENHEHEHEHGGQPVVEARQFEWRWSAPRSSAPLVDDLAETLHTLVQQLEACDGCLVGHVKCALAAEPQGLLLLRSTGAAQPPDRVGQIPPTIQAARLTLNVLAYRMDPATLARLTEQAVQRLRSLGRASS